MGNFIQVSCSSYKYPCCKKMLLIFTVAILPAVSWAGMPSEKTATLCNHLETMIGDLDAFISDAAADFNPKFHKTLAKSKICSTVGWTALPKCMADGGGDHCVEEKTEQMARDSLTKAMPAAENWGKEMKVPAGHVIFHGCKIHAFMKLVLKFKMMKSLLACEPNTAVAGESSRKRRNAPYHPQYYGVNTLWFQYHLCQDEEIYCWFFTDQWRQGDFGDYYLYDNLLDGVDFEENSLLPLALLGGGAGDSLLPLALLSGDNNDNLLPLALLSGGLGGGHAHGYGGVRYRRGSDETDAETDDEGNNDRKRREDDDYDSDDYDGDFHEYDDDDSDDEDDERDGKFFVI